MSTRGDIGVRDEDGGAYSFKRHLVLPGLLLVVAELVLIIWPLYNLFAPMVGDYSLVLKIALPALAGAQLIWWATVAYWLAPLYRAITVKRRGDRLSGDLAAASYRATWNLPFRMLTLRTFLWVLVALALGFFLVRRAEWGSKTLVELSALTAIHAFATNLIRSLWYMGLLGRLRARLFSGVPDLRRYADGYFGALLHVVAAVAGATIAAIIAFVYFFLPISIDQYLEIQMLFPGALALSIAGLYLAARGFRAEVDGYLEAQLGEGSSSGSRRSGSPAEARATAVYRHAQILPYKLALVHVILWSAAALAATWVARGKLAFELDDAVLMFGIILVIAVGSSIYQALWHREVMRPLLDHLTLKHRLPVRGIRTAFSLRAKLLLSFGGLVLFACGMALFWAFIQYKNLVTDFTNKQADLGLAWLRSEVQAAAAPREEAPTPALVEKVLVSVNTRTPEASAVFYYLPAREGAEVMAFGGGVMGAPELPWYARAQLELSGESGIDLRAHSLSGERGRLVVKWHGERYDLGALAVFYPNYRGRGPAVGRPLRELLLFFMVLFGLCGGIVLLTIGQFVKPIRRLEQRADGMARGELAEPVSSGGESDEVGRLTFALEEMRRALREKLRSTEEVNLDLERAVQRRTADLAKKNRELAETLEKLTRAHDQLVRSEKMASIGQLVAGIAHEINNPVNAIVNTVGPLEEAIEQLDSALASEKEEASGDVKEMLAVVKRGAQRTKAIVQALHNYSRTDDESVVEVDLNRSLDDSLELLRHLLKQKIGVERDYGEVGRVRGHAGQLGQVFMNLLTNAAQAVSGREGALVTIKTYEVARGVAIDISDNGEGIPPGLLPRIFDPFFTTKDVGDGSGLGLSIVHGIVERHGGTIEVDSEPGVGTTFTVTLPRGQGDQAQAADLAASS